MKYHFIPGKKRNFMTKKISQAPGFADRCLNKAGPELYYSV